MAANIVAPILKYSHATSAYGTKSDALDWRHDTSNHMFLKVIGKDTSRRNGLLDMAIVRGTATLESLDLAMSIDDTTQRRREGQPPTAYASHKDSVLQISFLVKNNQLRRVQLRFELREQCQNVVRVLQERGMEMREPRSPTSVRRPDTAMSDHRSDTAQSSHPSSSTTEQTRARPSTIRVPDMEAGSLSGRPAPRSELSTNATTSEHYPMPYNFSSPRINPRNIPAVPSQPNTTNTWRHPTVPSQPVAVNASDYKHAFAGPIRERPSSTSRIADVEAIHRSAAEDNSMDVEVHMRPPSSAHSASIPGTTASAVLANAHPAEQRPATGISSDTGATSAAATLRQEHSSSSRPSSALSLTLAPLPKPRMAQDRPASSQHFHNTSSASKSSHGARPATATMSRQELVHSNGALTRVIPMDELLAQQNPTASRADLTTLARMGSLADAPHEIESPPATSHSPRAQHTRENRPPDRDDDDATTVQRAYTSLVDTLRLPEDGALEAYSAQAPDARLAIMDQFIIDNLENPSFTTLCEDVEKCWRRIGLGL